MINITCDGCQQRFEVPDSAAGTTVPCPKCNTSNGVPGRAVSGKMDTREDEATARLQGEKIMLTARRAMFRARPARFMGLLLLTLGGLGGAGYFLTSGQDPMLAGVCGFVALVGLLPLVIWKVATMGELLEITSHRTILKRGILSKTTTEVRHNDIKNFQIDQSLQQRIFNCGTVGISSSGQDGIEIYAKDIPKPYRVREIIDRNRGF
ncbi:MAG: PH domain-containing protein [Pyrinomonadaceae bacterium]|nr:PH domain-containing protein [Phycisphaerales bacterium]